MFEKIESPKKVEVRPSANIGYGVFATEKIHRHEIIEVCHLIDINTDLPYILADYRFQYVERDTQKRLPVIPLGFGCIYNHSDKNNAMWRQHKTEKLFEFYAIRDIDTNEEIFTKYGTREYWENNLFYKQKNIKYSLI
jgi:SET domain-containing protein